jgi:hypothetical protein
VAQDAYPWSNRSSGAVTDTEHERLARRWACDGIIGNPGDAAEVYADNGGMRVFVRSGTEAIIRGRRWLAGGSNVQLTIAAASSQPRLDYVVLRTKLSTLSTVLAVVQGTAAGSPVPPTLLDDGDTYEMPLRRVRVLNGVSAIAADKIEGYPPYWASGSGPCHSTDRQFTGLPPGAIKREHDTGNWIGWTGSAVVTLYDAAATGVWQTYTPDWHGTTTNPALGNGTITGRYMVDGKTVRVEINLVMGSTTTYGSGVWSWSLPVTARDIGSGSFNACGSAMFNDSSAGDYESGQAFVHRSTNRMRAIAAGTSVDATHPWTWGNGDDLNLCLTYEST